MPALPPFLEHLSEVDRQSALSMFEEATVAAGEHLIGQGSQGEYLAYLVQGEAVVLSAGDIVGKVGPGEMVGEMALFTGLSRTATVEAQTDCWLLLVRKAAYEHLRSRNHPVVPLLERLVLETQIRRMRELADQIANLADGGGALPTGGWLSGILSQFARGGTLSRGSVDVVSGLLKSKFFDDMPHPDLEAIAAYFKPLAVPAGTLLCAEGEVGDTLYVVEDGEVDVVKATEAGGVETLATLHEGAVFGVMALLEDRGRMASCVAGQRTVVLALDHDGWRELEGEPGTVGSEFRRAVIACLADQLAYANRQLAKHQAGQIKRLMAARVGVEAHPGR